MEFNHSQKLRDRLAKAEAMMESLKQAVAAADSKRCETCRYAIGRFGWLVCASLQSPHAKKKVEKDGVCDRWVNFERLPV